MNPAELTSNNASLRPHEGADGGAKYGLSKAFKCRSGLQRAFIADALMSRKHFHTHIHRHNAILPPSSSTAI